MDRDKHKTNTKPSSKHQPTKSLCTPKTNANANHSHLDLRVYPKLYGNTVLDGNTVGFVPKGLPLRVYEHRVYPDRVYPPQVKTAGGAVAGGQ